MQTLWQFYDDTKQNKLGILLAGLGNDFNWYSNTVITGENAFDKFTQNNSSTQLLKQHRDIRKVIPCLYGTKNNSINDLVMLEGFLSTKYITSFQQTIPVKVVTPDKINPTAAKNIEQLMDDWIKIRRRPYSLR